MADLTLTALIIKAGSGPARNALLLPGNTKRLVHSPFDAIRGASVEAHPESRECTPVPLPTEYELHLRFTDTFQNPSLQWLFGWKDCDIFIANEEEVEVYKKKISHVAFRIFFNQGGVAMLQNRSNQYGIMLTAGDTPKFLIKGGQQALNVYVPNVVQVDDLVFYITYPTFSSGQEKERRKIWDNFTKSCMVATPSLSRLELSSVASAKSPTSRIGLRGNYALGKVIGCGQSGRVREVTEIRSGQLYAMKEYSNTEESYRNSQEISILQQCNHVSNSSNDSIE